MSSQSSSVIANPQSSHKILVVDDERGIRDGLKLSFEQLGFEVETAASGEEALYQFRQSPGISFVISDFKMPGLSGFDVLKEIKKQSPQTKVVLMTAYGSVHHAVDAMHLGADDYLCKPFHFEDLEKIVMKPAPATAVRDEKIASSIISHDPQFQNILKKAERAAKSSAPILIEGASGTGKELLARQIHEWSHRNQKPWVAVNCAALPAGLLESELFGFEKGAFTGAIERKPGKFEQASGGTLLLDEIGELDPLLQAKLLRVLQEGEIDRLGGRKPFKIDVRVIATTNKSLERLVANGSFREDLFFRLYGVRFILPSLKDRPTDIPFLVESFLSKHSAIQGRDLILEDNVLPTLCRMPWPGNIRQLERAVERASVLSENGKISLEHFELFDSVAPSRPYDLHNETKKLQGTERKSIREMEKEIILKALESHNGNRTHTAKSLGMSLRTLRHKLKTYREAENGCSEARQFRGGKKEPYFPINAPLGGPIGVSTDG